MVILLFLICFPVQVSLDPPIKQGQTRYPYLILLFSGDDTDYVELPLEEWVVVVDGSDVGTVIVVEGT